MRSLVPLALLAAAPFFLLSAPDTPLAKEPDAMPDPPQRMTGHEIITTSGASLPGGILDGKDQKVGVLIDGKDIDTWVKQQKADAGADSRQGSVRIGVVDNPGGDQYNVVRHTRVHDSLILPPPPKSDVAPTERKP